jgi:hypothetical protein
MAVAPIPIIIPLPFIGSVPIDMVAMMLLRVYAVGLRFVVIPLVIIFVLFIVVTMLVGMVAAIVVSVLSLGEHAIRQKKSRTNE